MRRLLQSSSNTANDFSAFLRLRLARTQRSALLGSKMAYVESLSALGSDDGFDRSLKNLPQSSRIV
jgi:hypothetical protein